jgi:predicted transcriptional regulator
MLTETEAHKPGFEEEQYVHVKKYRSRFEIAATILHVAMDGGATKTKLMYGSFLSFAQINDYLNFLLANELIKKEEETRMYALTEKGMRFLHVYEELSALIGLDEPIRAA